MLAVVRDGSFLGVVAEREEQAIRAREALLPAREMERGGRSAGGRRGFMPGSRPSRARSRWSARSLRRCRAGRTAAGGDLHQALHGARLARPLLRGRRVEGRQAARSGPIRQGVYPLRDSLATVLKLDPASRRSRTSRAPAATATTAPTTWRSMRRCSPAPCRDGRCRCSGCATTNSPGSLSARPW